MQVPATVEITVTDDQRKKIASINAGEKVTTLAPKADCRVWIERHGLDQWAKQIVGQYAELG